MNLYKEIIELIDMVENDFGPIHYAKDYTSGNWITDSNTYTSINYIGGTSAAATYIYPIKDGS